MERAVHDINILDKFAIEFCGIVEKHCKYIIVSGFTAIAHGRTRGTEDIDMILEKISLEEFARMHKELIRNKFICVRSDDFQQIYVEYLSHNLSVRYIWKGKPVPEMEIKLAQDELDRYQIQTRVKFPKTGLNIWFSTIEMNIAFKEELLKSPKDLEDARYLRVIYSGEIDEEEIERIKKMIKEFR